MEVLPIRTEEGLGSGASRLQHGILLLHPRNPLLKVRLRRVPETASIVSHYSRT
jgi:hypothetical protein